MHAKRVLELEAGLKALKEKEEEQLSVALTAPATKKEDAATAKLAADLEAFTKECASLKAAHADYLKGAVEAQSAQVAKVAAAHDEKVSELERSHSLAITGSTEYISDLEAEIAAFKKKETEERAATESRFEGIQKELLAVTTKRDLDVKALEEQLGASKKQLEGLKTHSAELKRETEKEQSAGKDSLVTVAAEHSTAIAGLKTEHSAAIAGLKSEHLKSITALKTEHSTALAAKEEAFNKLLQVSRISR